MALRWRLGLTQSLLRLRDLPLSPGSAAYTSAFDTATTAPQSSASLHLLELSMNAFGGIIRWNAAPTQQWNMIGNATPVGETILSANTPGAGGSALLTSHLLYEPY